MTDGQKSRVLGYIAIEVLSGTPEWAAYTAAVSLAAKTVTKEAVRSIIKDKLPDLPDDAVIDFVRYDDRRIQVSQILTPKKNSKRRGTDLTTLFE